MRLALAFATTVATLSSTACGTPTRPPPASAICPEPSSRSSPSPSPSPSPEDDALVVVLKPVPAAGAASAFVHVVITVPRSPRAWQTWECRFDHFTNLTATDDDGNVPTTAVPHGFALGRSRHGALRVTYDVAAEAKVLVQDDRFRAGGESLLVLPAPTSPEGSTPMPVEIDIDGSAITAPVAASTFGVGRSRKGNVAPRALQSAEFLAGAMGYALYDTDAHDEAAWLGYTAFDPRGVTAEMAEIRGALGELWGASLGPWTTLFLAQARPLGSFTTLDRAGGLFVELGPTEPWGAHLRLAVTHAMMRTWVGGELRFVEANPEETRWLDGVAWFEAMRALFRLGRLTPDDVSGALSGQMSIARTSPHRGKSNTDVAKLATADAAARALLVARGALYALRVNAVLRQHAAKPSTSLDTLVRSLLDRAHETHAPLSLDAWTDALTAALADGGTEAAQFRRFVGEGAEPDFASRAPLGPCFAVANGAYVAFDLGFDEAATFAATPHVVTGLEAAGPAARAGVKAGDVLLSLEEKGGAHAGVVALVVQRDGTELPISYAPNGASAKGPVLKRKAALKDDQCGDVL